MAGLLLLAGACEYQNEESLFGKEENCAEPVLFSTNIQPIIQANCALSGCHAAGGSLPALTTYEQVKARAAAVQHLTESMQMPPAASGKSLTPAEIQEISCWVAQGALDD